MHVGMGAFFQNLGRATSDHEVWQHQLELADAAEGLGFQSVWCAEHHFTDYTMSPHPLQFLTWVAARTRTVKLGSMVCVLPWHDPVRLAEEASVLDHISGGRLVLGIGRGLARVEFEGFRTPMAESRRRFTEYADAILTAFETGVVEYDGEVYKQPAIALRPDPMAPLRGRTYASSISPESFSIMARLGVGIMVIAQKPWEQTVADIDSYRAVYRELNGTEPPKPILLAFVAVHRDPARAEEMFERYIMGYCKSVVEHYEFGNVDMAAIPGYEYYGKLAENIQKHGLDRFARFLAELQAWGTPEAVAERLAENVARLDASGVISVFSFGGMPPDESRENMRLFAAEVLPRLSDVDCGPDIGTWIATASSR